MSASAPGRLLGSLVVACCALGSLASTAAAVTPSTGDYRAEPAKLTGAFTLGLFAVTADGGRRWIVSSESYPGIYYPDAGRCDDHDVPLVSERIPISRKGRFRVRERTPVGKGSILVVWKGAWVKPRRVTGTIRISYRRCDSKIAWVGRRAKLPTG
ncbi:MAG: hypothetical protein R2691_08820 [Solirubrobacterales bacterium]